MARDTAQREMAKARRSSPPGNVTEVALVFLRLGCSSFGGPVAHLGYFHSEVVKKRRWVDEAQFGDVVSLCQFLPGPASSQVVFALGMLRAGIFGALAASLCFTLPSALLMIGFAQGVALVGDLSRAGWLHGLRLAAVAVVAQAVWGMAKSLCPDRARVSLCLAAAAAVLLSSSAVTQVGVIAAGGAIGSWLYRREAPSAAASHATDTAGRPLLAAAALVTFLVLLVALPLAASASGQRLIAEFDSFYRSGSLVFGGGHVVLPLLRAEVVPSGWLSDEQFLAGYGAAQALPGPLFTFAAYLGAAMNPAHPWLNGSWCLLGIFLPAWLLVGGALPFWHRLRGQRWAQGALAGANAAVVGVLLAALYRPVIAESVQADRDVVVALLAFALLQVWKVPAWAVVALMAAAGQWLR